MGVLERVWVAFFATVLAIAWLTPGGGDASLQRGRFTAVIVAMLLLQVLVGRMPLSPARRRQARTVLACLCLPVSFSSLGWLLPAVHPEPWEWCWLACDRALFGTDVTVALQRWAWPPLVEVLQWAYASFYLLPIAAVGFVGRHRGGAAFDRAMTIVVTAFLLSYQGYLLFPTLQPDQFLDHGPVRGLWAAAWLHDAIPSVEANRWDCFPSGHTMLSLVAVIVVRRWAPRRLLPVLALALAVIASTLLLHYHWASDVLAGALLAWPAVKLVDFLLDLDCAEPA
ncbi:MAG TPA: phosphatase PAP2 family protein [Planctomycetota bacterium]|nr:phosphatase PAP2 family protein [Planctomycetota bacterium]